MNEDELGAAFVAEFQALMAQNEPITLELTPLQAWAVLSSIQLASRHRVAAQTQVMQIAVELAREVQGSVATTPAMAEAAARGWNRQHDVEETPY